MSRPEGGTARGTRFGAVVAGAVMTYLGSAAALLVGLMFVLGSGDGTFLGRPTDRIGLFDVRLPIGAAQPVELVVTGVGVLLVVLATLVVRRSGSARIALSCPGGLSAAPLGYATVTAGSVLAVAALGWIALAVLLVRLGRLTPAATDHPTEGRGCVATGPCGP
jgi:hypothetical protein